MSTTAPDYERAGRLAAVDEIARQLNQFELTPITVDRLGEALAVLDLVTAAAMDAKQIENPGPPYDVLKVRQSNWAIHYAETFRLAYDALNEVTNRKAVL